LVDACPDIVFAKNRDGCYVEANSAFCELCGVSRSLIIGMRDTNHVDLEVGRIAAEARARVLATGENVEMELELIHGLTKKARTFSAILAPVRVPKGIVGVVCFGRDVTSRVLVEKQLRDARHDAIEAVRARQRFLASVSHDLRQPLQAAFLQIEAASRAAAPRVGPDEPSPLSMAAGSLRDLKEILDRLFELASLDGGGYPDVRKTDLGALLGDVAAAWEPRARTEGVALTVVTSRAHVRTDPALLRRMLDSLIDNAIRHGRKSPVTVAAMQNGTRVCLSVDDQGDGIAPERVRLPGKNSTSSTSIPAGIGSGDLAWACRSSNASRKCSGTR
jgi:PAS domain S-box-containing protein